MTNDKSQINGHNSLKKWVGYKKSKDENSNKKEWVQKIIVFVFIICKHLPYTLLL